MSKIIAFIGPSGAGKTTLLNSLQLPQIISHTTRLQRSTEHEGIDYYYISKEDFEAKLDYGDFAEYVNNYGDYYGTTKEELDKALASPVMHGIIVTYEGYVHIQEYVGKDNISSIFIYANRTDLEQRLAQRFLAEGIYDEKELQKKIAHRLSTYNTELNTATFCDFIIPSLRDCFDGVIRTAAAVIYSLFAH